MSDAPDLSLWSELVGAPQRPAGDLHSRLILDRSGKRIVSIDTQDVEPVLEQNAIDRSTEQHHDCARLVARVPNVVLAQWLYEEHARGNKLRYGSKEYYELVYRKLQDPDFAKFRTDGGAFFTGWR